jgi:hypothetical protein
MRHRFFLEDDLIKIGWGREGSQVQWDGIIAWVLQTLDRSPDPLHIMIDLSDMPQITEDTFAPQLAAKLAGHPQGGWLLIVHPNPIFVHFVNQHWITQTEESSGVRAFLEVTDALSWLRNRPL